MFCPFLFFTKLQNDFICCDMGHTGMLRITTNDLKWKILPLFHFSFCWVKETVFKMSPFLSINCCYCSTTGIRGENLLRYSSVQPVHFTDAFFLCLNAWKMVRALVLSRQCCLSLFLPVTASFPSWSKRRPGEQEKGQEGHLLLSHKDLGL